MDSSSILPIIGITVAVTLAMIYLVAVSGMFALLPICSGVGMSYGMMSGVEKAPASNWKRKSRTASILGGSLLSLVNLAPSILVGWLFGPLAFFASAWVTVITMSVAFHFDRRF